MGLCCFDRCDGAIHRLPALQDDSCQDVCWFDPTYVPGRSDYLSDIKRIRQAQGRSDIHITDKIVL